MSKEVRVLAALSALEQGTFKSIRAAAAAYDVDNTTLARRKRGHQNRRQARQQQQLLSPVQEELLVRFLLDAEQAGHAFNHAQMRDLASLICSTSGGSLTVGKN